MKPELSRRQFLARAAAGLAAAPAFAAGEPPPAPAPFPVEDLHVHLDNATVDQVLARSRECGIKFGIVEHAGTKTNKYPVVLANDGDLRAHLAKLAGRPVYRGIQAEFVDWRACFSREALAELDFILSDAMTIRGPGGARVKMWEKGFDPGEAQAFMDRYVDWHVEILTTTALDILASVTWLPDALMGRYDELWTEARMRKVIEAAVRRGTALEISASRQLPRRPFLNLAKAAGAKFSFGSNGRYPNMGRIEWAVETARALGLAARDLFRPGVQPNAVLRLED